MRLVVVVLVGCLLGCSETTTIRGDTCCLNARVFGGVQLPVFDNQLASGRPMAGQSPAQLATSASLSPGWNLGLQIRGRTTPRVLLGSFGWIDWYATFDVFNNSMSSVGVPLGDILGVSLTGGIEFTKLAFSAADIYLQLGGGVFHSGFSPSQQNTEFTGESPGVTSYIFEVSLGVGSAYAEKVSFDLRVRAYYMPQHFESFMGTTDVGFDIGHTGLTVTAGVWF